MAEFVFFVRAQNYKLHKITSKTVVKKTAHRFIHLEFAPAQIF